MTVTEFEAARATLECQRCGHEGLAVYRPENGNHVGARCPACQSKAPLAGVQWLSQGGSADHIARKRGGRDVREVWATAGDHCSFCGKSWDLCVILNITRTKQHVWPIMFGGSEEGLVIPFCARCQESSRAAIMEARDIEALAQTLDRLRKKFGEPA